MQPEVATLKVSPRHASRIFRRVGPLGGHFLPRLVAVPLLPRSLPCDELVDFSYHYFTVHHAHIEGTLQYGIHIQLATGPGTLAEKFENAFDPSHQRSEESVI